MAYVYLIEEVPNQVGESGPWTKIGYSSNPPAWRMVHNLTYGNPRTIRIAALYGFDDNWNARKVERQAHQHFASKAHQKEWFRLSALEIGEWFKAQGHVAIDEAEWPNLE